MSIYSQTITISDADYSKLENAKMHIIDTCKIEAIYNQTVVMRRDSLGKPFGHRYRMMLQVGNKISKYLEENYFLRDSILKLTKNQLLGANETYQKIKDYKISVKDKLFINYPSGKITTRTNLLGAYVYKESMPTIEWNLVPGTSEKLGYKCKKATCDLFGRKYEVWYAPDIPSSAGPWKLRGLPGLILSVSDLKEQIYFECVAIHFPKRNIFIEIEEEGRNTVPTTKKEFVKMEKEYLKNPAAFFGAAGLKPEGNLPLQATQERKKVFIELEE